MNDNIKKWINEYGVEFLRNIGIKKGDKVFDWLLRWGKLLYASRKNSWAERYSLCLRNESLKY